VCAATVLASLCASVAPDDDDAAIATGVDGAELRTDTAPDLTEDGASNDIPLLAEFELRTVSGFEFREDVEGCELREDAEDFELFTLCCPFAGDEATTITGVAGDDLGCADACGGAPFGLGGVWAIAAA
jgi:hypothetical protein